MSKFVKKAIEMAKNIFNTVDTVIWDSFLESRDDRIIAEVAFIIAIGIMASGLGAVGFYGVESVEYCSTFATVLFTMLPLAGIVIFVVLAVFHRLFGEF